MKVSGKSIMKWKKPAGALIVGATVLLQTPAVALAKFGPFTPATTVVGLGGQYIILLSRVLGPGVANSIAKQLSLPQTTIGQGVSLLGPINATTGLGAGLLIFDHFAKGFNIPYYSSYLSWLVKALGVGNFIAGLIGGFLDPPTGSTRSSGYSGTGASAGGPSGYAHASSGATY